MPDEPAASPRPDPPRAAAWALVVVCLGMIAAPLDSAVNIAFPSIVAHFSLELQDIRWVPIVYVLTYASLLLIFGRLGDLVGHRIVFQLGLLVSTLGLGACALAPTFAMLLLGRVLQGIGVALLLSCAPALAVSLYDERERVRILGVYTAVVALGSALGPILGGILVQQFGWSAVYWARLPLVIAALVLSGIVPSRPGHGSTAGLDQIGSVQLAFALCTVLGGFSLPIGVLGPALHLGVIALGCLCLIAFVRRQARHPQPIIRPALLREPVFALMNAASVIANLAAFSVPLIVPFHLVGIARLDAGFAGLMLALAAIGTILGSLLAERAIRASTSLAVAGVGMALSSAGLLGIASWPADVPLWLMAPPMLVQGFGFGLFQVAHINVVTATLPVSQRGVAGSLTMLTRSIGIAVGAGGLVLLHQSFAGGGGGDDTVAFMTGFRAVFVVAGLAQLAALAIGWLVLRRSRAA